MRPFFALLLIPAFCCTLAAQTAESPTNENQILDEDIRTPQLHLTAASLLFPVVDIKAGNGTLTLEFDHLGTDIKDYYYTIVHCNADWQPSELDDNQYIDGFTEDRILQVDNSFNTLINYTHYTLLLPNSNMRWSKSGNYLLKVMDNDDDKRVVLVRRFLVVEPAWGIEAQIVKPAMVSKLNSHHEIDFSINPKAVRVSSPEHDVMAYVVQNGRWDNIIGPLKPYITRSDRVVYDYQDKIVFPAGQEYRFFDMSTFDYKGEYVRRIDEFDDRIEVTLQMDKNRAGYQVVNRLDINGQYVIRNKNFNQNLFQCDYAKVLFSIARNAPEEDADVYVFGELTDWQLKPEFKMKYNEEVKAYYCEPLLKQGYYNYAYAVIDRKTGQMQEDGFEGNWYQTGNQYTILTYFRPFGARYDRLLGAVTLDSKQP
jgi:hypothetical protein